MVIKRIKENLLIEGDKASIAITTSEYKPDKMKELGLDIAVFLDSKLMNPEIAKFVIDSAGEFEVSDIFVYTLSQKEDGVDIVSVDVEGVKVLFLNKVKELPDDIHDHVGVQNVMVYSLDESNIQVVEDIVSDIGPEVFIPITDEATLKKVATEMGKQIPELESKLKYSASDFGSEDAGTVMALLS